MPFDLVIRGGTLVDGTDAPGRPADVGVEGGRIAAMGGLAAVEAGGAAMVIAAAGRAVAPGFIDIHGHSDASVLVAGALVSHLAQGFTTQVTGSCGDGVAPVTTLGREGIETSIADVGADPAVIVNRVVALRDGVETGARPGRLLRRA